MGIRDFLNRMREKKLRYKQYSEDMRVQEEYDRKKKSANERELERYMEEERQKKIKVALDGYRKKNQYEIEHNHQILNSKNMFEKEKPVIMKQKGLFGGKSNLNTPGGLFWK